MITKHITDLLGKEGFVFVNGLGKFSTKFHEAALENGTMVPPFNEVVFENDESGNGFALIMGIANSENIGIVAADEKINQWVAQLKEELAQKGEAHIEGFGTFNNQDGNISFKSEVINSLNAEYEGMDPIAEQKKQGLKNVVVADISLDEAFAEDTEDVQPVKEAAEENEVKVAEEPVAETEIQPEPIEEEPAPKVAEIIEPEKTEEVIVPEPISEPEPIKEQEPETVTTIEPEPEPEPEPVPEPISEPEPIQEENNELESAVPETPKFAEQVAETEDVKCEEETENIEETIDNDGETTEKKKKFNWGLLILVIVLALLTAAVYYFRHDIQNFYHQWQESRVTTVIDTVEVPLTIDTIDEFDIEEDSIITEEIVEPVAEIAPVEVAKPAATYVSNGEIQEINFESGKYYVIAGSFVTVSEAKQHIRNRHLENYNPTILRQNGSERLRVCIGVFTSESDANALIAQTGAKYWVLK